MKKLFFNLMAIILLLVGCVPQQASPPQISGKIKDIAVELVTDLSKGEFAKAANEYHYTAEMKKIVTEQFMREQLWQPLIQTYGAFETITGTVASPTQGYDAISVKTTFAQAKLNLNIVFDQNKLIAGINYTPDLEAETTQIPAGVKETEIKFGQKEWELPGTLQLLKKRVNILCLFSYMAPDRMTVMRPLAPINLSATLLGV
ncbi:MAG: DUF3887 domain-containing protein [Clostridia bacterium]|nr:DUF3887 domain-containing protein [Clostridia bacterium]